MGKLTPGRMFCRHGQHRSVIGDVDGKYPTLCHVGGNGESRETRIANANRIEVLWNACSAMADPEGEIAALRRAADVLKRWYQSEYGGSWIAEDEKEIASALRDVYGEEVQGG